MPPPNLPHTTQPLPHPVIPSASLTADPSRPQRPPDDELENIYDDDPPAHYPKPGHGLAATLPPEEGDLHWLVDDNQEVYSHIYQTDPKVANEGVFEREYAGQAKETEKNDRVSEKVDKVEGNNNDDDDDMDVHEEAEPVETEVDDEVHGETADEVDATAGAARTGEDNIEEEAGTEASPETKEVQKDDEE